MLSYAQALTITFGIRILFLKKSCNKNKKEVNASDICIGNGMICSDIWHKYYKRYFEIVTRNFTSRSASEI